MLNYASRLHRHRVTDNVSAVIQHTRWVRIRPGNQSNKSSQKFSRQYIQLYYRQSVIRSCEFCNYFYEMTQDCIDSDGYSFPNTPARQLCTELYNHTHRFFSVFSKISNLDLYVKLTYKETCVRLCAAVDEQSQDCIGIHGYDLVFYSVAPIQQRIELLCTVQ